MRSESALPQARSPQFLVPLKARIAIGLAFRIVSSLRGRLHSEQRPTYSSALPQNRARQIWPPSNSTLKGPYGSWNWTSAKRTVSVLLKMRAWAITTTSTRPCSTHESPLNSKRIGVFLRECCNSVPRSPFAILGPVQKHATPRWLAVQLPRGYATTYPRPRVWGRSVAGQDLFGRDDGVAGHKRFVSEDGTYSSEQVAASEDEDVGEGVEDAETDDDFEIIENDMEVDSEQSTEIEEELDDLDDSDGFWDDDEDHVEVGDGGCGGGVVLGETEWAKRAFELAQNVVAESGNGLSLFAFKVSPSGVIKVRLDKLSDRYGSPTVKEIERFSKKFTNALESSREAESLPADVDVEVSSPGAERLVRVPGDLQRFKDLPMYVKYEEHGGDAGMAHNFAQQEGVLELDSLDMDEGITVWRTANVNLNRGGKGRPLNSKQKKWRARLPFEALKHVRLYVDA